MFSAECPESTYPRRLGCPSMRARKAPWARTGVTCPLVARVRPDLRQGGPRREHCGNCLGSAVSYLDHQGGGVPAVELEDHLGDGALRLGHCCREVLEIEAKLVSLKHALVYDVEVISW